MRTISDDVRKLKVILYISFLLYTMSLRANEVKNMETIVGKKAEIKIQILPNKGFEPL